MAWQVAQHDNDIIKEGWILIRIQVPTSATGTARQTRDIKFQFPPKISDDSREGEWDEKSAGPNSGDIIAVYKTAKPRSVTLDWIYVLTGHPSEVYRGNAIWNAETIQEQLRFLRGYFRNPFVEGGGGGDGANSPLVVNLWLWGAGGRGTMSFRLNSVNIKHDQTIIGTGATAFPLRTEVSANFKSWPKIGNPPVQTVPGQRIFTPEWF